MEVIKNYIPQNFIILRNEKGEEYILTGEYGGYLYGDSWRLSTKIVSVKRDKEGDIRVKTKSKSQYILRSNHIRITGLMGSILSNFDDYSIVVNNEEEFNNWISVYGIS